MNKNKYFHVVICIHPMLNLYIQNLLKVIDSTDYIIIEIYTKEILPEQIKLKRYQNKNKLQTFINLFKIKNLLDKLQKKHKNIHYYIPHPIHIITNYIAFSLLRPNDNISLIADGIMNYYSCKINNFKNKMKFFKTISYLIHINYKLFNDHCTAYNIVQYKYLYVIYKKGVISINKKMNLIELKIERSNTTKPNNVLILGQPTLDIDAKNELLISQINIIGEKEKIFYKLHPSETILQSTKLILENYSISILEIDKPIESSVNVFNTYISTTSSVLINMKILNPNVKCIAVLDNYKLLKKAYKGINNTNLDELKEVFKKLGVVVYE